MKNFKLFSRIIFLFLITFFFEACGPKINSFNVTPLRVCANDTVHISYDVSGQAKLETFIRGNEKADTISYLLVVEKGGKIIHAQQDVIRYFTPQKPLIFWTKPLGQDSIICVDTVKNNLSPNIVIEGISVEKLDRQINITHEGKVATIEGNGIISSAFKGTHIWGEWILKAALAGNEVMGNRNNPPPARIRLIITFNCN